MQIGILFFFHSILFIANELSWTVNQDFHGVHSLQSCAPPLSDVVLALSVHHVQNGEE